MSDNVSNGAVVQLEAEPAGESGVLGVSSGEISFGWKLKATAVPVPELPGKWRVSLLLTPEGNQSQPFASSEVDMELDEVAIVSFIMNSPPVPPDNYGVSHFETILHDVAHDSGNTNNVDAPVVQMRFKLVSNGSMPTNLLIENTSITIFWIIGARNISLTTTDV